MTDTPERPSEWHTGEPNLIAAYPSHVPMGLPLPVRPPVTPDEDEDSRYSL